MGFFFLKKPFYLVICFWLCWVSVAIHSFSLVAVSRGCSLAAVPRLLTAVASRVAEHGLQSAGFSGCGEQA